MFIVNLHYIVSLEQIDHHMNAHMKFLKKYYDKKIFMMSGRKVPRTVGIILAKAGSLEEVEAIMNEDPFISHKLAKSSVIQFNTSQYQPEFKTVLMS
ncbi:YciI family protein [Chryseosolibacter indicus]|uniref:GTP cyclohydrolase n=1 Tax=Chryseosolibacter indicus TaxID=2782351 RepID=A0ABS5VVC1_9BACT|nr:YciI family protein [Chryseosolibacter indicus]MBT1705161.1 GTP cyclohydrolase [Chryseosolibacter indicus]